MSRKLRFELGDRVRLSTKTLGLEDILSFSSPLAEVGQVVDIHTAEYQIIAQYCPYLDGYIFNPDQRYTTRLQTLTVSFDVPVEFSVFHTYDGIDYTAWGTKKNSWKFNNCPTTTLTSAITLPSKYFISDEAIAEYESLKAGELIVFGTVEPKQGVVISNTKSDKRSKFLTKHTVIVFTNDGKKIKISPKMKISRLSIID